MSTAAFPFIAWRVPCRAGSQKSYRTGSSANMAAGNQRLATISHIHLVRHKPESGKNYRPCPHGNVTRSAPANSDPLSILRFTSAALLLIGCVSTQCGCSPSTSLAESGAAVDTRRLPRVHLGRDVFASPASTIYISRETVENTVAAVVQQLAGAGWQQYTSPVSAQADKHGVKIASFKEAGRDLSSLSPSRREHWHNERVCNTRP